jgi:ParB family chromosome partitioning protein
MRNNPIPLMRSLEVLAAQINAEHDQAEAAHATALRHARRCGDLLLEAKRLVGHGNWLPWVETNLQIKKSRVEQYIQFAKAKQKSNSQQAGNLYQDWQDWQRISGHKRSFVTRNTGEQEWVTPPQYLDAARAVLGGIDLDPASCILAQETVQAKQYYTREEDGLKQEWKGRVWLNPPYSADAVEAYINKLLHHVDTGAVTAGIVLCNNASDTKWYHSLLKSAAAICVVRGRIAFVNPKNQTAGKPLQGQTLFYLGCNLAKFYKHFNRFGVIMQEVRG